MVGRAGGANYFSDSLDLFNFISTEHFMTKFSHVRHYIFLQFCPYEDKRQWILSCLCITQIMTHGPLNKHSNNSVMYKCRQKLTRAGPKKYHKITFILRIWKSESGMSKFVCQFKPFSAQTTNGSHSIKWYKIKIKAGTLLPMYFYVKYRNIYFPYDNSVNKKFYKFVPDFGSIMKDCIPNCWNSETSK